MQSVTLESLCLLGFFAGMLGGLPAAINAIYGNFKKLPARPLSVSKEAIRNRALFIAFRVSVAGILGMAITFWFAPDVISQNLALPKLIFIQFVAGYAGSVSFKLPFAKNSD